MRQFNRYILLFIFLSSGLLSNAQFDNVAYDKEKFLIGTLNDYMGYQRTFTNSDSFYYQRVDIMGRDDVKNALFIDSLFEGEYQDIVIVSNGASQGIKIYSPSLSSRIDRYYDYKPSVIMTSKGDTIYGGELKKEKFETSKDRLSFILGAYLRYGEDEKEATSFLQFLRKEIQSKNVSSRTSKVYGIFIPNSLSKARLCTELLKDLKCKNIEYVTRPGIPAGHLVFFTPSSKVKKVIEEANRLGKYIESLDATHAVFTPDGKKFIWDEAQKTFFEK